MADLKLGEVIWADPTIGAYLADLSVEDRQEQVFVPADLLEKLGLSLQAGQMVQFEEDEMEGLDQPIAKRVTVL